MIDVTCHQCRRQYEPDHSDYVAGRWRLCHRCRDGPPPSFSRPTRDQPPNTRSAAQHEISQEGTPK